MDFSSDYLKLRKERAGTSSGGTEQNTAPPEEKSTAATESSFNQNYMALRDKRNSMTISEKVEKRVKALKKKQGAASPADVLEGRRAGSGSYYTRPSFGSQSERLYGSVRALDSSLAEKREPLETAETALRKAESDLKITKDYIDQARAAYEQDPSEANAAYYNQLAGAYEQARQVYDGAFEKYSAAYGAYKPYEDQLVDALTAYQFYNEQQSAAFDAWRGTIRDAAAIRQEIETVDAGIEELETRIGSLEALTSGRNDDLGASMRESLQKATEELQTMQRSRELLQEELDWSQHYRYADLMDAADFGARSGYVTTANGKEAERHPLSGLYLETGFDDLTYDYINRNEDARGKALVASIADNTALLGLDTSYLEQMTDDEIAIFNYLYATQGPDAAYEYTAYLTTTLTQRQRMAQEAQWAQYAAEKPVAASVFSVAMSPLKGVSFLGQAADKAADGTIDQNAAYNKFSYAGSAIRNQVSEQIEKSGKWGAVGSFAYQTGMSMGDFLLNTAITGGNQGLSLAIMGSGAAADTVIAGKDRGLSDDQAFTLGAVAGLAEVAMEKISLDTLLNPSLLRNGSLKYILKNMVAEGGEEVGTDLINLLADVLIAKDQSEWQQSIDGYVAQGRTEQEAFGAALKDQLLTMGLDFLGGALSGGIMSSAGAIAGNRFTNKQAQELEQLDLSEEDVQAFIETGLESAPDTDAYHIAREMQQKLEAGQELSSNDLSRLYQANIQAVYEEQQTEEQPEGLTLRAVDAEETAPAPVTQNQGKEAENNAAPWQQEPEWNGGTVHGEYEQNGRSAAAQPGSRPAAGEYVPDGSGERLDGAGAGEQAGILAGGPVGAARRRGPGVSDAGRAAAARRNLAQNLRLEKVSSLDLGLSNGTETKNVQVMPREHWDEEMGRLAYRVYQETGRNVTFVMGRIQIRTAGGIGYARGVITPDRLIVQADNLNVGMEQITDHELYHAKTDFAAEMGADLTAEIRERVLERFTEEEFQQVLDQYIEALRGVIDVAGTQSLEEYTRAVRQVEEELLADAYAGINAFGAGADQFTEVVNESMDRIGMGKRREQDNGAEQPTGPPGGNRYSIETLPDGKKYVRADRQVIFGNDPDSWSEQVEDYINGRIRRGQDVTLIAEDGDVLTITSTTAGKLADNHTSRGTTMSDEDFYVKANAAVHIDELAKVSSAVPGVTRQDVGGRHGEFASGGWTYRTAFFMDFDGKYYRLRISAAKNPDGTIVYNIGDVKERSFPTVDGSSAKGGALGGKTSFKKSVPQADRTVKQRFSYAGENANNADLEALTRAKEMQAAGVAEETIRQQTGWHVGMDGKWRWEIDDSGMRYDSSGDLRGAESAKINMQNYEDAREDLWGHADMETLEKVRAYNRADIAGDKETRAKLYDELMNGQHAYYFFHYVEAMASARKARNAPEGGTLQDYIEHPALFEAYPQLRNVSLRFEPMSGGNMGYFSAANNEIVLNRKLRYFPDDVLVHEIQHAIQRAEGFARGSSVEYWQQFQDGEGAVRTHDAEIQDHEKKVSDIMRQLPENVAEQFRSWYAMDESSPEAMALMQELGDGPYGQQFNDYFLLTWSLDDMKANNYKRGSRDLYENTAGEIEARDSAARRTLTPEQRRGRSPVRSDSRTVFMEDVEDLSLRLGDRYFVDDTDSQDNALSQEQQEFFDAEYMEAVEQGDMAAAQQMVDEAAERWGAYLNNDEANEYFHQDGRVRTFYHGTNTGDFTTFDSRLLGNSSGDLGWFGKGFYFAFSRKEAATYGGRVIPAYLRMRNPFDYSQLFKYEGSDKGASEYARFAWVYNVAKQFPDIVRDQQVWAYPDDADEGTAMSWLQLAYRMDRIRKKVQFSAEEVEQSDGTTAWELRADPKKQSFTAEAGETFEWTEYGMRQIFATEKDAKEPINQVGAYLKNVLGVESIPRSAIEEIDFSGALQRAGYDGVLQSMSGDEAVVFSPEQIKSAEPVTYDDSGEVIPLSKRFDTGNADIRYSVDDTAGAVERYMDEGEGSSVFRTGWLSRNQNVAEEIVKHRPQTETAANTGGFDGGRADIRYSTEDKADTKKQTTKKKVGPIAESRPIIAKRNLKNAVFNTFSIPGGMRAAMGDMIDLYADRLLKNGSLSEEDRQFFFDRLYESGVMTMPAEEYYAAARNYMKGGRIYVSDDVVADLGDDWNDIRKRAFAAGIYLTRSQMTDGHRNTGIDVWNGELAADLPGLFDSEETDQRSILERIIWVAEAGKEEQLSLQEYTARLAQQEYVSEDEILDNLERQMDWALRTFAESARLEIKLRDRTGVKIAEEREKSAWRTEQQRARESKRRADERQARKENAQRQKERRELRELQQKTLKQLQWLSKNRQRAPEELKETWNEVLGDIDLYAVGAANEMHWSEKHGATWKDLAQMYKDAQKNDPNFLPSKELERIVARLDGTKIAEMDVGALQDLYKAAVGLRTEFYNRNNVINDEMQRLFAEVYADVKREMEAAPGGFTGDVMDKLMNLDQLTPMNVMQRMAGWDPDSAFFSMAKQLERGERDMRAYSVKAQKMLQEFLTEHEDWVKKADGQGEDAIWYEAEVPQLLELGMGDKPIFGETVKVYMTPAQKVHMYLESKNLDNLRHMTGGRTFADKGLYSKGKRQEALSQGRTIRLAPETVRKLVSDLTPEEIELARILDRYYNTFATQEINKVSNILYGYDKAMGKNYAPIYTNRNYTKTEFGVFDTTAEGVGNLKGRQYAVNPSYNISAFDAFERHVDQTARFCGMAIPARNWTTLMNWREQNNSTGDVITHKWGEESKRYITDLITTLQGGDSAKSDTLSAGVSKLQSNYITAIFGANPSIVLKQLGSIPLAGAYLEARNVPTLAQIQGIDRDLIAKYTQELEWRTMGYTTPETKQLKDNPNWTQTNKAVKFVFGGGAITAMDGWAASTLWPWAENKVRREHPELEMGTEKQVAAGESPFYRKVAEEFENALTRSQSVSDEIHQGTLRKSKNPITKAFTMFRSDSAQTYNTLRQKIGEAQFYARTGAKTEVLDAAKKAAGTAFVAMMLNAAWAEAINFLMALWKNKGKYYRDDDDELTVMSAGGEMVSGMLGSFAGIVTGGEELFDVIGNILTGDTWYGIDTPGMEQLNDLGDILTKTGGDLRKVVAGGWDVLRNGGDMGAYIGKNSGKILGGIKDLAEAAAMYLPGMPVSNLEAYLLGAVKWVSPELGAAYDDLFSDVGKSDLAGAEGSMLQSRIHGILSGRKISESSDTAKTLAALYEAGLKTAVPSDTPTSISVNGEKRTLGAHQQQVYDAIWGGVVADALDDIVAADVFAEADAETQAKMLSNLYSYAAERAKTELFDDYEPDSGAVKNAAIVAAGASVAECIAWNTITSGMKSAEKSTELAAWDLPDPAKRAIFLNQISDSREDTIEAFGEVGLSFDQFLQAYSKYGEINAMDLKASGKALEFAYWTSGQGYSEEQAAVVKDELTYFNMTPASSSKYEKLVDAGMDPEEAYDLAGELNGLQAEDGADSVSDLQKWRASVDFADDVEDQLTALYAVMSKAQYQKVEIAHSFGVSPDAYVTLQEVKPRFDANGNGSYTNAEIKAAVDSMGARCTKEQKAVLWQLATGSKSAKNNPYSPQIGQRVLDAKAAAKEAAAQEEELEGLTLGSW